MSARAAVHALLPIVDSPAEADEREKELDRRLDAYRAEVLAEGLHAAADEIDQAQNRLVVKKTVVNLLRRRANQAADVTGEVAS